MTTHYVGLARSLASVPPDENEPGRSHTIDPTTARSAGEHVAPITGKAKLKCLLAIAAREPRGATWDELEVQLDMYSAQKRVSELKLDGWIEPSGRKRLTRRGRPAEVLVLSEKGYAWLFANAERAA